MSGDRDLPIADRAISRVLAPNFDGTQKPLSALVHDFENHKGKLRKCFWLKDLVKVLACFPTTDLGKACHEFNSETGAGVVRGDYLPGQLASEQAERIQQNPHCLQGQIAAESGTDHALQLRKQEIEFRYMENRHKIEVNDFKLTLKQKREIEIKSTKQKKELEITGMKQMQEQKVLDAELDRECKRMKLEQNKVKLEQSKDMHSLKMEITRNKERERQAREAAKEQQKRAKKTVAQLYVEAFANRMHTETGTI